MCNVRSLSSSVQALADENGLGMAAAAAAEVGTSALPQIGSPSKKTARIQIDVESATTGQASDAERMRNKRGSIGVTKLNETKARRAAALQAQQACHLSCLLQAHARPAVPLESCLLR